MDALPSLPSLTPDNRFWRVDWFGECAYPGGVRRYAQPSIRVALSPLRCDPKDDAALSSPDCTDHQHQHEVWPPVAALPLLAVGDIWHEGRHIASPDYKVESFKGLRVVPETSAFVKAGLAIDEHFLLPLGRHPWHRNHTQSYCVAVTLDGNRRLLVPCMELIRFYFGSSSNLLQRLFTAPLRAETLWTSKRFNPENRHLHLVLANRLSGMSAADIGRVAESGLAWRAAAGVYASCQKAAAQRHPVHPYTGFPFEGTTDLEASGIWLPFGDQIDATFLVYRLRSCSFPFPFRSLSYQASDRKAWRERSNGPEAHSSGRSHKRSEGGERLADGDPGTNKAQRRGAFLDRRQFPDLARKQVWREKIEVAPKPDVFLRHADGSLEQVAFGEADSYAGPAGIDIGAPAADSRPVDSDCHPRFISVALKAIATAPEFPSGAQLTLLRPTGNTAVIFSLPIVADQEGEIEDRLLYAEIDGRMRPRRACFAEISVKAVVESRVLIVEGKVKTDPPELFSAVNVSVHAAAMSVLGEPV